MGKGKAAVAAYVSARAHRGPGQPQDAVPMPRHIVRAAKDSAHLDCADAERALPWHDARVFDKGVEALMARRRPRAAPHDTGCEP